MSLVDVVDELAPGREAVLSCDDELGVPNRELAVGERVQVRDVGADATRRVLAAGESLGHQAERSLVVGGHRLQTDPSDGWFGPSGLDPARELRPRAKPVLGGDHPLGVAEPEALAGPLAECLLDALRRSRVAAAPATDEILRLLAVPLDVEPSRKLVVHDDPSFAGSPGVRLSGRKRLSLRRCVEI
jgi:hypothetical protein